MFENTTLNSDSRELAELLPPKNPGNILKWIGYVNPREPWVKMAQKIAFVKGSNKKKFDNNGLEIINEAFCMKYRMQLNSI